MKMKLDIRAWHWFDICGKSLVDTNFEAEFAQHIQICKHFKELFILKTTSWCHKRMIEIIFKEFVRTIYKISY